MHPVDGPSPKKRFRWWKFFAQALDKIDFFEEKVPPRDLMCFFIFVHLLFNNALLRSGASGRMKALSK